MSWLAKRDWRGELRGFLKAKYANMMKFCIKPDSEFSEYLVDLGGENK